MWKIIICATKTHNPYLPHKTLRHIWEVANHKHDNDFECPQRMLLNMVSIRSIRSIRHVLILNFICNIQSYLESVNG